MADHPAPSHLTAETDPALRAEFDSYMQGFALTLDPSTPSDAQQRSRRNGIEGARALKVARSMADLGAIYPLPTVAPRPSVPLIAEDSLYSYQPKPVPRRLIVAPKASAQLTAVSRVAYRLRLCRQLFSALFLTKNEALEECPDLLPHMVPVVVVNP